MERVTKITRLRAEVSDRVAVHERAKQGMTLAGARIGQQAAPDP